jgi:hypothetical protein
LPKNLGFIIIPSTALVKKAGSDFDIDKLSMYLKNLFSDNAGRLKVVPFLYWVIKQKNNMVSCMMQVILMIMWE